MTARAVPSPDDLEPETLELALRLASTIKTMRTTSRMCVQTWLSAHEEGVDAELTLHTGKPTEATLTMGRSARRAG